MLATLENLENELVAFFPVLAEEGLDVFDGRCVERLEAVSLVDAFDDADDMLSPPDVLRQEVAHAARRFSALHQFKMQNAKFKRELASVVSVCILNFAF